MAVVCEAGRRHGMGLLLKGVKGLVWRKGMGTVRLAGVAVLVASGGPVARRQRMWWDPPPPMWGIGGHG